MKLDIKELTNGYATENIFTDISFNVNAGEILCLLGSNGVGKTTLFKTILGSLKPRGGDVLLDNQDITKWSREKIAQYIGYVPQYHSPSFPFTVLDIVLMGRAPYLGHFKIPSKKDRDIAIEAMQELNIGYLINKRYTNISGGEKQLVLIARALTQQPKLLIMDEPTANLDFGNQIKILKHIQFLAKQGKGIIISTHIPDHALRYGTNVAIMKKNMDFTFGKPDELLNEGTLKEIYDIGIKVINTSVIYNEPIKVCIPL